MVFSFHERENKESGGVGGEGRRNRDDSGLGNYCVCALSFGSGSDGEERSIEIARKSRFDLMRLDFGLDWFPLRRVFDVLPLHPPSPDTVSSLGPTEPSRREEQPWKLMRTERAHATATHVRPPFSSGSSILNRIVALKERILADFNVQF